MLVSFADRRFTRSAKRIAAQAGQFKVIDRIEILSEQDLDPAFVSRFRDVLKPNVRGFGYYCWKPQVILQSLRALDEGDVLIYVDAGAHLFAAGEERLLEYIETCSGSQSGVLAFQTTWPEASWTKGDLFDHFGVRHNPELTQSGQLQTGLIVFFNSPGARRLVSNWLQVYEGHFGLVDDTRSVAENFQGFVENRHDQSVFSVIAKIKGIVTLPASEQTPRTRLPWQTLPDQMPVEHWRDLPTKPWFLEAEWWKRFRTVAALILVKGAYRVRRTISRSQ